MSDKDGQYIYAIVATDKEKSFGPTGIGDRKDEVYTVCYQDIGAVISSSPVVKYSVTRANTMAHQNVMEKVMKDYPMLPVRFGTIGEGTDLIREKVLKARYDELKELLTYIEDKMELGLKVLWTSKESTFLEIVDENRDIRMFRDRLMSRKVRPQRDQVRLGDMVKKALETKKMKEEKAILDLLKELWVEHKKNDVFGDQMITNSAFLIRKDSEKAFDEMVDKLMTGCDGKMKFKYVGPVPPCNFVEIVVKW
ncbi:MAG: GvpL/GvpF family gas vesicle protein [Syntrophales bacterium]|nr:GvpL/GvpF family gas vesicle protein [Syntrophales bacterium]